MILLQGNCLVEESSLSGEVGSNTNAFSLHVMTQHSGAHACFVLVKQHFSSTWKGFKLPIKLRLMPVSVNNVLQLLCNACLLSALAVEHGAGM